MAKKKAATSGKRLNRELLERARQQARAIEAEEAEADAEVDEAPIVEAPATSPRVEAARAAVAASGAARRPSTAKRLRERNEEARKKAMTAEEISEILANPTKTVSETQLREQYGFVLRDLRSMATLAGASFLVLIALAVLLPK